MTTPDVNIFLINFPRPGNEMVVPNEDGSYTILINARLSNEGQLRAYQHAMKHITDNDFSKSDVQSIEAEAHGIIANSQIKPMPGSKYLKRLQALKRRHKQIQRELEINEEKIYYLQKHGLDNFFEQGEYLSLYGDDLWFYK